MKQTVDRLQEIESQMEAIGENIRKEEQVYRAELEERQRPCRTGGTPASGSPWGSSHQALQ